MRTIEERSEEAISHGYDLIEEGDPLIRITEKGLKQAISKALRDLVEECAKTAENHESSGHCCEDCPCSYYGEEVAKKMRELSQ